MKLAFILIFAVYETVILISMMNQNKYFVSFAVLMAVSMIPRIESKVDYQMNVYEVMMVIFVVKPRTFSIFSVMKLDTNVQKP